MYDNVIVIAAKGYGFWEIVLRKHTWMYEWLTHMCAPSNRKTDISNCYRKHEAEKKTCLWTMEHSTFTPLAFSATRGMAKQSTTFYKRLASLLAVKWDHSYSSTLSWLRCRISFSLLRSAIQSIRGGHSSPGYALRSTPPVDLAWWTMRHKLAVPEVTFWTHSSSLLIPCVYLLIFPTLAVHVHICK